MKYYVEEPAEDFQFWGAAKEWIKEAEKNGTLDQVLSILEDSFIEVDDLPSDIDINDYVSFYMPDEYPELFGLEEDEEDDDD